MEEIQNTELAIDGTTSSWDSPLRETPLNEDEAQPENQPRSSTDAYLPCHYFDYIGGTSMGGYVLFMHLKHVFESSLIETVFQNPCHHARTPSLPSQKDD